MKSTTSLGLLRILKQVRISNRGIYNYTGLTIRFIQVTRKKLEGSKNPHRTISR
uniref:Uncharacterized protein n=1 Tax=Lepeophtheirus salmonis TaxID=72036 RepID=A0A0K2UMA0_LEPSM